MNGPARLVMYSAIALFAAKTANAQPTIEVTPPPIVTAQAEQWYHSGEPVMFAGHYYYPAGAQIHFISNEMVHSGTFQGVPLYSRTTIEPYSVVFVPLAGGVMQPYERRRDGQLAGTVGSYAPSFPVATSRDLPRGAATDWTFIEAAAPPMLESLPPFGSRTSREAAASTRVEPLTTGATTPPVVNSTGAANQANLRVTRTSSRLPAAAAPPPIVPRADSANGVFVEFDRARWFSSGRPAPLDTTRLTRVGELHGFPVYADRGGSRTTIYLPVSRDLNLVAPYSRRQ